MREKYTKTIRVRLTENDYKKLERSAKNFSSMSKFIRTYLFSKEKTIIEPKSFVEGMHEFSISINRVGNNINQIARHLNQTKNIENPVLIDEWLLLFEEYKNILRRVDTHIENIFSGKYI